jgi:AcrR family transcriptional regulator
MRRAIERSALRQFITNGFDATTIDQIADSVEMSPRTFFRYFPTKEDVVFAHAPAALGRLLAAMRARPSSNDELELIRDGFLLVGDGIERHRFTELARARLIVGHPSLHARALEMQAEWEHAIARELASRAGLVEPDLSTQLVTTVGVSAHRVAFDRWRDGLESDLPEAIVKAFELLPELFSSRRERGGVRRGRTR